MTSLTALEVLASSERCAIKPGSWKLAPLYRAVRRCVPRPRPKVVNWARLSWLGPPVGVGFTVASGVPPSKKVTSLEPPSGISTPTGMPPAGKSPPVTVAVKVLGWLTSAGLSDAVSVVVVAVGTERSSRHSSCGRNRRVQWMAVMGTPLVGWLRSKDRINGGHPHYAVMRTPLAEWLRR